MVALCKYVADKIRAVRDGKSIDSQLKSQNPGLGLAWGNPSINSGRKLEGRYEHLFRKTQRVPEFFC